MRILFVTLALVLAPSVSLAQEEDGGSLATTAPLTEHGEVTRLVTDHISRGGLYPRFGSMGMVPPYVCTYMDFDIPPERDHPYAGLVLRILQGECIGGYIAYVHDPRRDRRRIVEFITRPARVEELLAVIEPDTEVHASE